MKYLITGNLGYIGPVLAKFLKNKDRDCEITGYDIGYFQNCEIGSEMEGMPPYIDKQIYGDVRDSQKITKYIEKSDHIIHLAAISNDPMGKEFEKVTFEINRDSSVFIAKKAIEKGCKSFVFASSCSVYGSGSDSPRTEEDQINPLTAYAKSKIETENILKNLKDLGETQITCLRFATACGYSPNLRLDLVLNDFVATALNSKKINILSDGSPWRPLIDVEDMSRAIYWACNRNNGKNLEIINTGSSDWNYKILELAESVKELIGNEISININKNSVPDKRSYMVDFKKYISLAPNQLTPKISLKKSVSNLIYGIKPFSERMSIDKRKYLIRLNILKDLKSRKILDKNLNWIY